MKTEAKDILSELDLSKRNGNVIGIKIRSHQDLLVTAVEEIENNHHIIHVKPCNVYGRTIQDTIDIDDIEGVVRFKTKYEDPLFVKIRAIKQSIIEIRSRLK